MSPAIGWINSGTGPGQWGAPDRLTLPCDARGVLLAEGLFETVLVRTGQGQLLAAHLQRWQDSAALLGLAPPPARDTIEPLLHEAVRRSGIQSGALRLNWCRGSGPRGLQAPDPRLETGEDYLLWLQLSSAEPLFAPAQVIVSPTEVRQATSLLSRCKTFGYGSALVARRQALAAGADDALLLSSSGGLCCGTSANLLIKDGDGWLTPPLASGCLPGVMRQRAIDGGLVREAAIAVDALEQGTPALLLNSLDCRPIRTIAFASCDGFAVEALRHEAAQFWRQLLPTQKQP